MHNWAAQVELGHKSVFFGQGFGCHGIACWERKRDCDIGGAASHSRPCLGVRKRHENVRCEPVVSCHSLLIIVR